MKRIVNFTEEISKEKNKLMWVKYFFKCLSHHWNSLDNYSINEYLSLLRAELVVLFNHFKLLWEVKPKYVNKYMNAIYEMSLKESDVPLGVGMHMADIYLDELLINFEKSELTHERIVQLLSPFLKALGNAQQLALFQRIKEKIFLKLFNILENSSDDFAEFKLKDYAEKELFKIASEEDTMESRRSEIYELYEKATGKEKPVEEEVPYAERIRKAKISSLAKPITKHQKNKIREKVKKANKLKKRIMKMIRNEQLKMLNDEGETDEVEENKIEVLNNDVHDIDDEVDNLDHEVTPPSAESINILELLNMRVKDKNGNSEVTQNENGDKIVEINTSKKKKKKSRKRKALLPSTRSDGKKVVFKLEKNEVFKFYKS